MGIPFFFTSEVSAELSSAQWGLSPDDWSVDVYDRTSDPMPLMSTLLPSAVRYTRRLNAGGDAQVTVVNDPLAGLLRPGSPVLIRANGSPRAAGIVGAQQIARDGDNAVTLTIDLPDPFTANVEGFPAPEPGITYTATDQGELILLLLAAANVTPTHLTMSLPAVTRLRDRTYPPGKDLGEAIRQLSQVIEGPFFRIDPMEPDGLDVAEIVTSWPEPGSVVMAAALAYGDDTIGNVDAYELTLERSTNAVMAIGAGDPPIVTTFAPIEPIDAYGAKWETITHSDVDDLALLGQYAQAKWEGVPVIGLSLTLVEPSPGGPFVPMLGRDFDVGDTLPVYLPDWTGLFYVTEGTVEVTEDGRSRTSSLVLVSTLDRARRYVAPVDGVIEVLTDYDRRIRSLETGAG